jgi:hypothetical protein
MFGRSRLKATVSQGGGLRDVTGCRYQWGIVFLAVAVVGDIVAAACCLRWRQQHVVIRDAGDRNVFRSRRSVHNLN